MPRRNHRRRAILFLAAVLLPSAVLVGTTLHLIRQERELALRRAQENRVLLARGVGEELAIALGRLADRVGEAPPTVQDLASLAESEPAILTLAVAEEGQLTFPWEMASDSGSSLDAVAMNRYEAFQRQGEEAEYRTGDLVAAVRAYGQAVAVLEQVDGPEETVGDSGGRSGAARSVILAEARVHQARALARAQRKEEARGAFRFLADCPPFLYDSEGMPFVIYGLDGLHRSGVGQEDLLTLLEETLTYPPHFSSQAVMAWREIAAEIAGGLTGPDARQLLRRAEVAAAERAETLHGLEALRDGYLGVLGAAREAARGRRSPDSPIWVPYGPAPWLVGFFGGPAGAPNRVAVVEPDSLRALERAPGERGATPPGTGSREEAVQRAWANAIFLPAGEGGGESLGPALNGLRADFPPGFPEPAEGGVEGWFFRLLLPLILLSTAFTAYLAWRDVRRETEAARLRSQFVSSVTHELKTPLTSIRMFVETLRLGRHSTPEARQEYLDTVVHETERLSRLINNVLDFARIDRGEKVYRMAPTDVGAATREAARAVAYPLAQGGYELATEIGVDLPTVHADGDSLTQALLNLLSNAIKFSEEGSRIDLRVSREESDLLLEVQDRGRGIPVRDQEAIFQDFFRSAEADRDGIPGTGLGLPLVAHVTKAHGGRVEVESEVGRGTTFTIRIPIRDGPEEKSAGGRREPEGTGALETQAEGEI
jgi:two-component system phosphate regulon sensor histidine kinase PhoR